MACLEETSKSYQSYPDIRKKVVWHKARAKKKGHNRRWEKRKDKTGILPGGGQNG